MAVYLHGVRVYGTCVLMCLVYLLVAPRAVAPLAAVAAVAVTIALALALAVCCEGRGRWRNANDPPAKWSLRSLLADGQRVDRTDAHCLPAPAPPPRPPPAPAAPAVGDVISASIEVVYNI